MDAQGLQQHIHHNQKKHMYQPQVYVLNFINQICLESLPKLCFRHQHDTHQPFQLFPCFLWLDALHEEQAMNLLDNILPFFFSKILGFKQKKVNNRLNIRTPTIFYYLFVMQYLIIFLKLHDSKFQPLVSKRRYEDNKLQLRQTLQIKTQKYVFLIEIIIIIKYYSTDNMINRIGQRLKKQKQLEIKTKIQLKNRSSKKTTKRKAKKAKTEGKKAHLYQDFVVKKKQKVRRKQDKHSLKVYLSSLSSQYFSGLTQMKSSNRSYTRSVTLDFDRQIFRSQTPFSQQSNQYFRTSQQTWIQILEQISQIQYQQQYLNPTIQYIGQSSQQDIKNRWKSSFSDNSISVHIQLCSDTQLFQNSQEMLSISLDLSIQHQISPFANSSTSFQSSSQFYNSFDDSIRSQASNCCYSNRLTYKIGTEIDIQWKCPICLSQVVNSGRIAVLPCNHSFHEQCGDRWLIKKSQCPICRNVV